MMMGTIYFLTTLVALAMFVVETVRLLSTYYRLMFENVPTAPSAVNMLLWFAITLAIYILSLWDTHRAFNALLKSHSRTRLDGVIDSAASSPPPLPTDAGPRPLLP